jgi:hypothetical protein
MKTIITTKLPLPNIPVGTVGYIGCGLPGIDTIRFPNAKTNLDSAGSEYTLEEIKAAPDFFDVKQVYEKSDLEKKRYWKDACNGQIIRIQSIVSTYARIQGIKGKLIFEMYIDNILNRFIPATTPEIEAALIKEAVRRGLNDFTKTIKKPSFKTRYYKNETAPKWDYDLDSDALYHYGNELYYQGVWAEIIEEKKDELLGIIKMLAKISKIKNYLQGAK